MGNVLVLNMGLKSVRSIIFDNEGNKLSSASKELETILNGNHITQNPSEWWIKSIEVIKESVHNLECSIDYITVTTSAACLVYIDDKGKELDRAIMVSDKRASEEAKELKKAQAFEKVYTDTGLGSNSYLMVPKIMWIKKNHPKVFEKVYKFLSPNDYLIGKLTGGKYYTDYFNAQKYHYDIDSKTYPTVLLNELGIDENSFPKVVAPGTVIGKMDEKVAHILGFSEVPQIVISTYDAICSFFGSGPTKEGDATDVSGTVTTFRVLTHMQKIKKSSKVFNQPCQDMGINIVGGSNNLGGGLIEWVKQCYYINEPYPYEIMEKEARESALGASGLIFLPYLLGERAPLWDNDARGVFFGIERTHTRKDMTKAVFESAGFVIKDMIDAIEETGVKVNSIRFSGGLARINLIAQLKADITGKDIVILDDFETTSVGAAMLVLVGVNEFSDINQAANKFVSVRMIVKPNMKNHKKYLEIHKLYKETYMTLEVLFKKRKELVDSLYKENEAVIENL